MPDLPVRKNVRLEGYDYSQAGCYFVTICIKDGHELLWEQALVGAASCRPQLTPLGRLAEREIKILGETYSDILIDNFVVMPNHVHMIVRICGSGRQDAAPTLSRAIGQYKRAVSMKGGYSIWQKSFHDRIIRSEAEYQKIWQYIDQNPARWQDDCYYTK